MDYHADPPLTALGAAAFSETARQLATSHRIDTILHSPKKRAVQTASLLLAMFPNATLVCREELREISSPLTTMREEAVRIRKAAHSVTSEMASPIPPAIVSHQHLLTAVLAHLTRAPLAVLAKHFNTFGAIVELSPPSPPPAAGTQYEAYCNWRPVLFR